MRRKAEYRSFFHSISAHLLDHVRNIREPVSHGDVNRNQLTRGGQFRLDQPALFQRDLRQRAVDDERVAALYLFDDVLRQSDFICVHVPLTPETRHLFDEPAFRKMKPTAYFINVARGAVHDEAALARALRAHWIAGAGLDVYENEPQITPELLDLPNVVLLPHIGSATIETRERMALMAAENLLAILRGERCDNEVVPSAVSEKSR